MIEISFEPPLQLNLHFANAGKFVPELSTVTQSTAY
jgi:hypothetical protein